MQSSWFDFVSDDHSCVYCCHSDILLFHPVCTELSSAVCLTIQIVARKQDLSLTGDNLIVGSDQQ
jgi:hypothetical protein